MAVGLESWVALEPAEHLLLVETCTGACMEGRPVLRKRQLWIFTLVLYDTKVDLSRGWLAYPVLQDSVAQGAKMLGAPGESIN